MENYVVAYLLEDNTYEIKFVVAEDAMRACSKVIPRFELLVNYVQKQYAYVDYNLLMEHKSTINMINFDCISIPSLNIENNIKTQIIALYDTNANEVRIIQKQERTKRDALLAIISEYGTSIENFDYITQLNDMKQIIITFAHLTGIRVYTVDTLRALVKASI